jgi:hypothetical protein
VGSERRRSRGATRTSGTPLWIVRIESAGAPISSSTSRASRALTATWASSRPAIQRRRVRWPRLEAGHSECSTATVRAPGTSIAASRPYVPDHE